MIFTNLLLIFFSTPSFRPSTPGAPFGELQRYCDLNTDLLNMSMNLNIKSDTDTLHGERTDVSVIVPVYNEEESLPDLFARLLPVLDGMGRPYEAILINDGSRDASLPLLLRQRALRPDVIRIIDFNGNFGQHMAIMAGFEASRGEIVVTLDADLQNPPEEIPRIVAAIDEGYDVVGTVV